MANSASLAFVFPGQGSQYPGMIKDVQRCGPGARSLLGDAQDITGLPVLDLMSTASAEIIADPHIAQVLVFLTSTVLLNELRQRGWRPAAVAGHSLGEYPALVAAEMLTWDAALRLVHARGTAMAAAAAIQPGAMAALVGLDPETVTAMCQSATRDPEHAVIANLNSATQLVVSGTEAAVEEVLESARTAGALRARRLPVGGAYHSALMQPAADQLRPLILEAQLASPTTTFVSSTTGRVVDDLDEYRHALANQVIAPVRWQRTVGALTATGIDCFVEVGPGRVLTGLARDNARAAARHLGPDLLARPSTARVGTGV